MRTLPLIFLVCCLAQTAFAQPCAEATQLRSALQSAFDAGLFDKAFENVKALRACDPASSQEADQWADRIFAEIKKRAESETAKTRSELKESTSNLKLLEARNYFDKSLTYKTLESLLKARELWDGNTEARIMLDSMADYCPDWMALASGYVGLSKKNNVIGYFDESTEHGGLCDYVVRNIVTGDTLRFQQVSKFSFFSMAAEFSADGRKIVYYTAVDSTEHGTINIYDSYRKKTFHFPNAILIENWLSENGRTFVFLKDTLVDKDHQLVCAFDFETESLHALGKSSMVPGDWRFWISPDGENVIYCTHKNPNQGDLGTFCLYNLKNKTSRNFDRVYAHCPEFSTDGRYLAIQHSGEDTGSGTLIDLQTGKIQTAIIHTTYVEDYAGPVTIRLMDYGERRISKYDPEQKKWVDEPMPKKLNKESDLKFVEDMLLYTFQDPISGWLQIGVYQYTKHKDFVFSDGYLSSMNLFEIARGFNKDKNICFFSNEYNGIVQSYDFENNQVHNFPDAVATGNKLRGGRLGFTTDHGDWSWVLKRKVADAYGWDLALVRRDGNTTIIDSGYFNVAFFANLEGEQTRFIYVQNVAKGSNRLREIVLFDPNKGSRTRLKAYASNQLSAANNDFTDLWLDEDRDLMVYSPAPKTFCVWDLKLNKVIRKFKIEQEYQNMELRGASGLLEINFKNGVKKWIQIDAPAKPFQWHLEQLTKQK